MNNKLSKIFFIIATSFSLIISIYLFIKSFTIYSDEYGTDISVNENYVIAVIVSLILLLYSIYLLVKKVDINIKDQYFDLVSSIISGLISFYSLGKFFKAWAKAVNKGKEFDFNSNSVYLFIGIFTLLLLIHFVINVYINFKKNKELSSKTNIDKLL